MGTIGIVSVVGLVMLAIELRRPGRRWPLVRGWWLSALVFNGVQVAIVLVAGATWDRWMQGRSLWSASGLGTVPGALVGYLAITFVYYWWHRARHEVGFLWRWLHQLHHSPQRIEILTSFYKHPLEIVANGLLSSAILYLLVGLPVAAASLAVLITGLAELFYHWNVKTPYCLGFIVQRPESHCRHHEDGWHRSNYSDLPLWDMLFGTFDNPRRFDARCGLGAGNEHRLLDMLSGRDLSRSSTPGETR